MTDTESQIEEMQLLSKWRIPDRILAVLVLLGIMYFGLYKYYIYSCVIALILLPVTFVRKLYLYGHSRRFSISTGITRTVLYITAVLTLYIPWSMSNPWRWYYPVQKAVYGTGAAENAFLPERIPDNAEDYSVSFKRYGFPGATYIWLSFFTDSATLDSYRKKAVNAGAVPYSEKASRSWKKVLNDAGVPEDSAEYYYFPGGSEHFPKVYILEESTGFVYIYW